MVRFRNSILTGIGLVVLFAVGTMTNPRNGYSSPGGTPGAPSAQTQNVNVVNTPGVIAQQAGVWNVGISGTPVVGVDPSNNTVKIDGNSTLKVGLDPSNNTVKIDGNSTVKIDPDSTVKIDGASTLTVRDADNPARQPFAAVCVMNNSQGFPCTLTIVPPAKLLVIEMFQGMELNATTNNNTIKYTFPQFSQLVRVYADPGSTVTAVAGGQGTQSAITGYLINQP
jgi:hypothetical protein